MRKNLIGAFLFSIGLCLSGAGQTSSLVEAGSRTAKAGFRNETEIAAKFDDWRSDADAQGWLAAMGYKIDEIDEVKAAKPHGEKADVQVHIRTKSRESVEGVSIKLVSNTNGFNQVDKRWLSHYAKLWKMPADVHDGLKMFVGEAKPTRSTRTAGRMYLNELDAPASYAIVAFFTKYKDAIVSDILEGDGTFAAKWFMVAYRPAIRMRWVLKSSADAAKFFGDGPVAITRSGNLKIGRITMQRKGGDGGRETAKMLQFKINPALLFEAK